MEKMKKELLNHLIEKGELISKGAESNLYLVDYLEIRCILKYRVKKKYRVDELDKKIRRRRTIREVSIIQELDETGVPVPSVIYVNVDQNYFLMKYINGDRLRDALIEMKYNEKEVIEISRRLGAIIAEIHNKNISHGDLTTANIIVKKGVKRIDLYILDFGLSERNIASEEKAVDIDLLYRVLEASHTQMKKLIFDSFLKEYKKHVNNYNEIILRFNKIRKMGRYIEERRKKSY